MTPKIDRIAGEIQKTRARIAQDEARVKELEEQKRVLENDEIIARVRASEVPLTRVGELLRVYRETGAPPRAAYAAPAEQPAPAEHLAPAARASRAERVVRPASPDGDTREDAHE